MYQDRTPEEESAPKKRGRAARQTSTKQRHGGGGREQGEEAFKEAPPRVRQRREGAQYHKEGDAPRPEDTLATLGIVAFVLALLLSVMIHEGGHFLTARRYGMKASKFFVGFGPTLWSTQRGETEYGIKAIPAGGFVKIDGMTSLETMSPEDEERAFWRQPARKRLVVLSAGSIMHFVIAIVLVTFTTYTFGVVNPEAPVVAAPVTCIPQTASLDTPVPEGCGEGTIPAPAAESGLREGDRVLTVDGEPVETYLEVVQAVRASPGEPLELTVQRNGAEERVTLTPATVTRPSLEDPTRTETVGAVGVGQKLTSESVGLAEGAKESGRRLGLIVEGTWTALTEKLGTITKVYSEDRDPEGLVGAVGAARVSGEIIETATIPLDIRIASFLLLIAGLNLFIGIFNLLPLPPLDGGHIAVVLYEEARHKLRRLRGHRGEVRRVDPNSLLPLTYAVMLLFIGVTLFILGADIVNPVSINP